MQTAPSGAVWTLSDSSSELLTALFELLTARQSCSERVVLVIRVMVDGRRAALERCDGVWLCDVMSCLHGYSLDSMHSDMSRDMTLPSDGLPHPRLCFVLAAHSPSPLRDSPPKSTNPSQNECFTKLCRPNHPTHFTSWVISNPCSSPHSLCCLTV